MKEQLIKEWSELKSKVFVDEKLDWSEDINSIGYAGYNARMNHGKVINKDVVRSVEIEQFACKVLKAMKTDKSLVGLYGEVMDVFAEI
jgi:hypothetical protein